MNPSTIIKATPWLRRLWRITPAPLRIPLLLVALVVGAWYVLTGRHRREDEQTQPHADRGPQQR